MTLYVERNVSAVQLWALPVGSNLNG